MKRCARTHRWANNPALNRFFWPRSSGWEREKVPFRVHILEFVLNHPNHGAELLKSHSIITIIDYNHWTLIEVDSGYIGYRIWLVGAPPNITNLLTGTIYRSRGSSSGCVRQTVPKWCIEVGALTPHHIRATWMLLNLEPSKFLSENLLSQKSRHLP